MVNDNINISNPIIGVKGINNIGESVLDDKNMKRQLQQQYANELKQQISLNNHQNRKDVRYQSPNQQEYVNNSSYYDQKPSHDYIDRNTSHDDVDDSLISGINKIGLRRTDDKEYKRLKQLEYAKELENQIQHHKNQLKLEKNEKNNVNHQMHPRTDVIDPRNDLLSQYTLNEHQSSQNSQVSGHNTGLAIGYSQDDEKLKKRLKQQEYMRSLQHQQQYQQQHQQNSNDSHKNRSKYPSPNRQLPPSEVIPSEGWVIGPLGKS